MAWPLDLQLWVDRLTAADLPLKTIGLAGDLQSVQTSLPSYLPGAWVFPASDSASSSDARVRDPLRQVTAVVSVVIGLRHYGDASGGKKADALRVIRQAVATALRGWQIDSQSTPVTFIGGSATIAEDGTVMWWTDNYEVKTYD